jgi:hypothetical protein
MFTHAKLKTQFLVQLWYRLCDPRWQALLRWIAVLAMLCWCWDAFAVTGDDYLKGTDSGLWATLNGTGKKYLYAAEGIGGVSAYIKTKNMVLLCGIIVVAIFVNIILVLAGEST